MKGINGSTKYLICINSLNSTSLHTVLALFFQTKTNTSLAQVIVYEWYFTGKFTKRIGENN